MGRNVKRARLGAGYSLDTLAAKVGTSRQHLIRIEKGRHLPRPGMLAAIAAETGKDESFFESEDDEESELPRRDLLEALYGALGAALKKTEPTASLAKATVGSNHHGG